LRKEKLAKAGITVKGGRIPMEDQKWFLKKQSWLRRSKIISKDMAR